MDNFLFIVPSLSNGGAERVVSVMASELAKKGKNVSIIIYFKTEQEYEVHPKVKILNLSNGDEKAYNSLGYIKKIIKLRNLIKYVNPKIIIPFLPQVCVHATLAGIGLQCKIIHTVRNNPKNSPIMKYQRIIRDLLVIFSWKTIVQNEEQKNYFPRIIHKKVYIMFNPIPDNLFDIDISNRNDRNYNIIAAGRLIKQKNFSMLIDAVGEVYKQYDNVRLCIYGKGQLFDELQNQIDEKNLNDAIKLKGRVSDMRDVYSKGDLFILSSNFEGMPNVLMEAMASGLPCISTNCPTGPSDIIINKENGILIPTNNINEMIKSIIFMYNNPKDAKRMSENARIKVSEECSSKKIIDEFIEICSV